MVRSSGKTVALSLVLLLVLANMAFADFSMRTLSVFININKDGSVNSEEKLLLVINGTSSRELYEATRAAYSDLATWKERTGLSEMRHHISRATADISNLRVIPQAIERCNSFIGICYATVVIDYVVPSLQNGSGLVKVDHYKPRTSKYSLQQDALSFEQTKTGDLVLPEGTTIAISIPQSAEKIYFSTLPQALDENSENFKYDQSANVKYYSGDKRIFTWQGDALSKFKFTYEIESPLEAEVLEFFQESQKRVTQFFFGAEGLAAIFILASVAGSAYYLNQINK